MRVVIAHFAARPLYKFMAFLAALLFPMYGYFLLGDHGHFISDVRAQGGIWYPVLIFTLLGSTYVIWLELLLVKQAFFDHRSALWIKDGVLIYLHRWYIAQKCSDIANISTGDYPRDKDGKNRKPRKAIVLTLHDGDQKLIPSGALVESGDVVVKAIRANIGNSGDSLPNSRSPL